MSGGGQPRAGLSADQKEATRRAHQNLSRIPRVWMQSHGGPEYRFPFCTHGGINRAEISALSLLPTDPEKQEVKPTSGISRIIKCSVCPCTLCTLCLERGTSECPSRDSFTDEQAPTSPRRGGRVSQRPHSTASILRCLHGKVFRLLIPGFTASSRFRERLLGVHLPCEV